MNPTTIHSDDKGDDYRMYYPVTGRAVPNDAQDFISQRVQARLDYAADIVEAAAGGPTIPLKPARTDLANLRVDEPK